MAKIINKAKQKYKKFEKSIGLDMQSREKRLDAQLKSETRKAELRKKERKLEQLKSSYQRPQPKQNNSSTDPFGFFGSGFDNRSQTKKRKKKDFDDDIFGGGIF